MKNPYQTPTSNPENESAPAELIKSPFSIKKHLKEYFSLSGSFTRMEFFLAGLMIYAFFKLVQTAYYFIPNEIPHIAYIVLIWGLYFIWGLAVGKRAKTVGFNMTSGVIMGIIFPIMALIFIFQEGTKDKEVKAAKLARLKPQRSDQS